MTGIFHERCHVGKKERKQDSSRWIFLLPSTYEFASILRVLWIPCIQLDPNWKGICPQLNRRQPVCRGKYLRSAWPNYGGTKEYHEFEARSGKLHNWNIQALATGARDTKIPSFSFVFARYKERENWTRGIERGKHNNWPREERNPSCLFDCDHGTITGW